MLNQRRLLKTRFPLWGMTLILVSFGYRSLMAAEENYFKICQMVILGEKTLDDFYEDKEGKPVSNEMKATLDTLKQGKDCAALLRHARLADNGLLINRDSLSDQILTTFDRFHRSWLTPEDLDRKPRCQDPYLDDFFDPEGPAYHLSRALFQQGRKASLAVTAYGDLRVVTQGQNPTESEGTGLSVDEIKNKLGISGDFQLRGKGEKIGYLYQRHLEMKRPFLPTQRNDNQTWKSELANNKFKALGHLGAGLVGNSRFILHYAHPKAFEVDLMQFNGNELLPRKLAKGIFENLLCRPLEKLEKAHQEAKEKGLPLITWKHPLNHEKQCLKCHQTLDPLAAGLRHLTYVKSQKNCKDFQIMIPRTFSGKANADIWQEERETPFHLTYPAGNLLGERFVGINQLGKAIASNPEFYRCQVKKYDAFFKGPSLKPEEVEKIGTEYQEHQDGLKLLSRILSLKEGRSSSL